MVSIRARHRLIHWLTLRVGLQGKVPGLTLNVKIRVRVRVVTG